MLDGYLCVHADVLSAARELHKPVLRHHQSKSESARQLVQADTGARLRSMMHNESKMRHG